jgi:hypothetical protein
LALRALPPDRARAPRGRSPGRPPGVTDVGRRIEVVSLSLRVGALSTRQLILFLDQLSLFPHWLALKELVLSPSGQGVVADLLLEIPTLKSLIRALPASAEPEHPLQRSNLEIPKFHREPFRSLLADNKATPSGFRRTPGLLIGDLKLTGIFATSTGYFAQAVANNKSYLLKTGDQLYDGEVVSISRDEIVFKQVVQDSTGLKSFREVRIPLDRS